MSRHTVRRSWQPYAGAFVALTLGIVLIGLTASVIAAVEATRGAAGVGPEDRLELEDLSALFGIMSAVALFMALFVVGSTFGFVVATRHRELGLLRLLGATPRQVRRTVLGEAVVVAVPASVVGCLAATVLTPGALWLLRDRGVTSLALEAPAPWIAWVAAVPSGVVVALLGAHRSSRRAARIAPGAALLEASVERRRPSWTQLVVAALCAGAVAVPVVLASSMAPLFALVTSVLLPEVVVVGVMCVGGLVFPALAGLLGRPFAGRDVAARLARDHVRTAVRTPAALAAPVLAISAIGGSMIVALSFTADWTTALNREQLRAALVVDTADPATTAAVGRTPGVDVADVRRRVSLVLGDSREEVDVVEVGAATRARGLVAVRGDLAALRGRAVAVSETWATDSGTGLGETVRARVDGRRVPLRVVAVVRDAPDLYGDVVVPPTVADGAPTASGPVYVVPTPGTDLAALARTLATDLRGPDRVLTAETWIEETDRAARSGNALGLWVLLGPAGLYAGIAIVNAVLIGASQRRRQLRVVHLLGATRDQVRRAAVWEAALAGGAGLLVGAAVVVLVGWLVRHATTRDVGGVAMTVPWLPLGAVALTCAVLVVAAALVGARAATRAPGHGLRT
ncbi:FtsX-like permease family protein [Nocardioides sp. SYSU D00038]|uniref:FtsX-like permease family protein n=1 Tax=Nocardioides sp. SYSU D00038 TaxID=2812554 RepID=UPI001967E566|nr:FtsX-like permease family protein [Nocardioides sp. SYSU D00038]